MEMECYRTVVPEPKEASGRRSLARSIKRELCDASDAAATQSTHVPFAAAHLKSEPIELLPQSYSYVLTAGFDVYPQIVYAQEIPAQRSEPDCRCIIDMSTPASLERDFYAWLNGVTPSVLRNTPCAFASTSYGEAMDYQGSTTWCSASTSSCSSSVDSGVGASPTATSSSMCSPEFSTALTSADIVRKPRMRRKRNVDKGSQWRNALHVSNHFSTFQDEAPTSMADRTVPDGR